MNRLFPLLLAFLLAATPVLAQTAVQPVGGGTIASAQVSVGAAAAVAAPVRPGRVSVMIENLGTTPVYIGGPGVTATSGALLPGTVGATITVTTSAPVYAVTASGTASVAVLETY